MSEINTVGNAMPPGRACRQPEQASGRARLRRLTNGNQSRVFYGAGEHVSCHLSSGQASVLAVGA